MQQQTTIENKPAATCRAARKRQRLSRSEREAARDRANVAATEALYAETEPRDDGGAAPLLPEAHDTLIGNRARLWRSCVERACRRARACTALLDICIAEPQRPDELKRWRIAHRDFARDRAAREELEALRARIVALRRSVAAPQSASRDAKQAKRSGTPTQGGA